MSTQPTPQRPTPKRTRSVAIDPAEIDQALIAAAAQTLRAGGLVAFPTETVYGLGANALDAEAVGRIFTAKGRPAGNPLIVHVRDADHARELTKSWPAEAERLAAAFWPGPLTFVLPRSERIPSVVTAGGVTVGVRQPQHPVAAALLAAARVPLAAPSANLSEGAFTDHGRACSAGAGRPHRPDSRRRAVQRRHREHRGRSINPNPSHFAAGGRFGRGPPTSRAANSRQRAGRGEV